MWDGGDARSTDKAGNSGGGKEPQLKERKKQQRTEGLAMSLTTPLSVQELQTALHDKAKGSPKFRYWYKGLCRLGEGTASKGAAPVRLRQGYRPRLVPTSHSIPHADLMKSVARRIVDGAMLHLIKMWLEALIEETDEKGNKHRNTRNRDEGRGTPQGAPISPLLSNLYMRRFVLGWKKLGHENRLAA